MTRLATAALLASLLSLAACGGGAGGNAAPPARPNGPAQAQIRLVVPDNVSTASALRRRALSIAFNTAGVTISAYTSPRAQNKTAVAQLSFDISATSTNCTATTAGGRTCTLAFPLPSTGTDDFVVTTYDTAPVNGTIPQSAKQLGIGVNAGVALTNGTNTVSFTVNGVVAAANVQLSFPTFIAVVGATQAVNVQALDAAGNTIVTDAYADGSGNSVSIALAVSGAASAFFQVAPASISAPAPNGVTLSYAPTGITLAQLTGGFSVSVTATPNNAGSTAAATSVQVPVGNQVFTAGFLSGSNPEPVSLVVGPDKNIWFGDSVAPGFVGFITESGTVTEFPTTTPSTLGTIAVGPDGNLWFTEESANKIGRSTTAGVITEFNVPTANSTPLSICAGPDGNLWFTEAGGNQIGRITTAGVITEFAIPTASATAIGITNGPDGALWFTEQSGNKIGRITTGGTITEFSIPTAGANPYFIALGPDNALWYGENNLSVAGIGRVTTSGTFSQFSVSPALEVINAVSGPDGNLWAIGLTSLVRISTSGSVAVFPIASTLAFSAGITVGPDGNIWWAQEVLGIGKIIL